MIPTLPGLYCRPATCRFGPAALCHSQGWPFPGPAIPIPPTCQDRCLKVPPELSRRPQNAGIGEVAHGKELHVLEGHEQGVILPGSGALRV